MLRYFPVRRSQCYHRALSMYMWQSELSMQRFWLKSESRSTILLKSLSLGCRSSYRTSARWQAVFQLHSAGAGFAGQSIPDATETASVRPKGVSAILIKLFCHHTTGCLVSALDWATRCRTLPGVTKDDASVLLTIRILIADPSKTLVL